MARRRGEETAMASARLKAGVLVLLASGCGGGSGSGTPAAPATQKADAAVAPAPTPRVEVTLTDARADALVSSIKGYKDKVVVVDFWATWCAPCVKKFPHLVELHKKHAAKGLVCVSVDMDKLGGGTYDRDKALGFLTKQGAAFPNFAMTDPDNKADDAALEKAFGEDFRLLPYLVIFDRGGRPVWNSAARENLDATPAQVEAKVLELLAK
jgi:thiol-disulfide isomerase/thioredoxin